MCGSREWLQLRLSRLGQCEPYIQLDQLLRQVFIHSLHLHHCQINYTAATLAMTSILDGEAHFRTRTEEVGMSDRGLQAILAFGEYSTLGRLAFGVGQLGTAVADMEFNRFATNALGGMATMHDVSS